ncbi:MAG: molybdopterin molybdotransferase MoeA [Gemmatimonadales bacterium]|nr:molybdopterin molybdotransferase MoeA [Gemmatimonadales bacterium]
MARAAASVGEAQRIILGAAPVQPTLAMPLHDAIGRILAADVMAPFPLPPWTNAAMDGYAVRADDVRGASASAPVALRVVGHAPAGGAEQAMVEAGTAVRIFTGGRVPEGADGVVRQEDTDTDGVVVRVLNDRDAGANVRAAGGDLARGALALAAGTHVGPRQLALLAALGVSHPMVHRAPRVGVLSGGDEVVSLDDIDAIHRGDRLADVNGPALAALVADAGGVAESLGIARDNVDDIVARVRAAGACDAIITAGGISVGEHDHVHRAMAILGARELVSRVRVRPGGPTAFAVLPDGRPWLALPGNPVSAIVTFELFGRPMIRAMSGDSAPMPRLIAVMLEDAVKPDAVLDLYLRATLEWPSGGGVPRARLTGAQGSGILTSVARADALVVVPAGVTAVQQQFEAIVL